MTNEEKILKVLSEVTERLTNIEQAAVTTNERLTDIEHEVIKTSERLTDIEHEVVKTNLKIENDITKRLDSLTDGYILTHEKQYELERKFEHKMEALEKRIKQLEIKAS